MTIEYCFLDLTIQLVIYDNTALRVLTPMYIRTPYRTGMGMNLRMGASLTESPVRRNTQIPVTRCSLTNESTS